MAKSPVGGSRAMLKGRIGSDVYSLGRDGKGRRQQVVRSLAEQVTNPRTSNQMFGRMVMSTVMQAAKELNVIIDHSFDNVPIGQPSISEFISRNYALVKADAIAHPASGMSFGLCQYQEKGMKQGKYVISAGKATYPSAMTAADGASPFKVAVGATLTYGALKEKWALSSDEYVTLITFNSAEGHLSDGVIKVQYVRMRIKKNLTPATVLTAANFLDAFDLEGNFTPSVTVADGVFTLTNGDDDSPYYGSLASIISRKKNGKYIHSNTVYDFVANPKWSSDVALPTYPVGEEQFLNGGDL